MDWNRIRKMLSRVTILLIAIVFLFSIFIGNILDIISINDSQNTNHLTLSKRNAELSKTDLTVINDQLKHTMVFLQISDIHLSKYFDPKRGPDLLTFCTQIVDIVNPSVVLATGDLTDSRTRDPMGSGQHEEEWIMYNDVLKKSNVTNKTVWLDIRGNHDNFNVHKWDSDQNFFLKYSIRGPKTNRTYKYTLKHETETYSFIGIDACLEPGPRRPFNFIGLLKQNDINVIKKLKHESFENDSNMTLWFGHYPTSSIATPDAGLREIINGPYFSGHFHTIEGLVQRMYSTQPNGYLEIELADWKDSRRFRLAAVDHGLFSFTDITLNEWPLILITNPKESLYSMPHFEPYHRILKSTHIRALIFSKSNITQAQFKINDNKWLTMKHISGPLYVHQWDPSHYSSGLHVIHVKAFDSDHNQRSVAQHFSLDGSRAEFTFGGRFMLRSHVQTIGFWLFGFSVFICVFPLILLRLLEVFKKEQSIYTNAERNVVRRLLFKLYLLSSVNKLFIPLISIPIYAIFGPWFIGHVIDSSIGFCFVWGMFVDGAYLPGGFTYIMGALLLIFFQVPMTFCLAHIIYCRHKDLSKRSDNGNNFLKTYCHVRHFLWLFFIICHALYSTAFYFSYGIMAYVLGFLNTWSYIIYIVLWYLSLRLNPVSFPERVRPKNYKRDRDFDNVGENDDSSSSPLHRK